MKKVVSVLLVLCCVLVVAPLVWAQGNDQYTVLLIHSDNADGDTYFVDNSVGGEIHNITANGHVHHSTDQVNSGFGNSSIYFDGTGDYLSVEDSEHLYMGTGKFTIDGWVYVTDFTDLRTILNHYSPSSNANQFQLYFHNTGGGMAQLEAWFGNGSTFDIRKTDPVFSEDTWYHIAMVQTLQL